VERDRDAEQAGVEELEPDHADEVLAAPRVELDTARHERPQDGGVRLVVEHHQPAPLRREELPGPRLGVCHAGNVLPISHTGYPDLAHEDVGADP
jgi:hypothetical protein